MMNFQRITQKTFGSFQNIDFPYVSKLVLFGIVTAIFSHNALTLLFQFHSTVPQWDEWDVLANYFLWENGVVNFFEFLLQPHNEHLVTTSKFLLFLDIKMFGGKLYLPKAAMGLGALLTVALLILCIAKNASLSSHQKYPLYLASVVTVLSPQNAENFTRAFNAQVTLVVLFGFAASVFFARHISRAQITDRGFFRSPSFWLFALFGLFATLTMSAAIVLWTIFLVWIFLEKIDAKTRIATILMFTFNISLFFFLSQDSVKSGTSLEAFNNLASFGAAVLKIHSIPFVDTGSEIMAFAAIYFAVLGLIVGLHFVIFRSLKDLDCWLKALLLVTLFVFGTCILITIGRYRYGEAALMAWRYIGFLGPAWVCLMTLSFASANQFGLWGRSILSGVTFAFCFLLVISQFIGLFKGEYLAWAKHEYDKHELSGIYMHAGLNDEYLAMLHPSPARVRAVAQDLKTHGIEPFSNDSDETEIAKIIGDVGDFGKWCFGHIDRIKRDHTDDSFLEVTGWVLARDPNYQVDRIVLANSGLLKGYGKRFRDRPDVVAAFPRQASTKFAGFVALGQTSADQLDIFAYSRENNSLCRLE